MRRAPLRLALCVVALAALLPACQVAEDLTGPIVVDEGPTDAESSLGSPDPDWPRNLAALQAYAAPEALVWQDAPVLADLTVWLDGQMAWDRVRLTYVAPAAERMLTYRSRPDEVRIERPSLSGLQLPELPREAVEAIAAFPDAALEPAGLAAASARGLADCGADPADVAAVLYATGAPASWDGTEWTRNPTWRATVVTPAAGVVVDPTTGQAFAPLTCVEPFLLDAG